MAASDLDLLIIGAGPAGLGVAREAQKARLGFHVVDRGAIGQSWLDMHEFEMLSPAKFTNLPDLPIISRRVFPTRREFVDYLYGYADHFRLLAHVSRWTEARALKKRRGAFRVSLVNTRTGLERAVTARAVVTATGTYQHPRMLGVPGENNPRRVSHYFRTPYPHAGEKIVIIGAGNTAMEAAFQLLDRNAGSVTILTKEPHVRFYSQTRDMNDVREFYESELRQRMREGLLGGIFTNPLRVEFNCRVKIITPEAVVYESEGRANVLPADYVYALTGYVYDTALPREAGARAADGALPVLNEKTLETTVGGLYAAGAARKCFIHVYRDNGRRIVSDLKGRLRRNHGL